MGPIPEGHCVFSTSRGQPKATAIDCKFWESLGQAWSTTQKKAGVRLFVRWSLNTPRSMVSLDKLLFKLYMYIYTDLCILQDFKVNS